MAFYGEEKKADWEIEFCEVIQIVPISYATLTLLLPSTSKVCICVFCLFGFKLIGKPEALRLWIGTVAQC